MTSASTLKGRFWPRIADIDRAAWNACFRGEAEDHVYYSACERANPATHRMGAVSVARGGEVVAVAPVFAMTFRLDASFQNGSGPLARARRKLAQWVGLPVMGFGSPFAERCHIGMRAELDSRERGAAFEALLACLEERARLERIELVAVKDIAGNAGEEIEGCLRARGYVRLSSLPVAQLDLQGVSGLEDYFARLSPATRKDLRRKLRAAHSVRIEDRSDIGAIGRELTDLYESTRAASSLDYGELEKLPPEYFVRVAKGLGERALFRLYWVGSTLGAFNLLFVERDRIIDKFIGMRYPLAREHNLYALSWVENVRLCLRDGVRFLQTGQTAYREKIRMGSTLVPTSIWFRHRGAVTHRLLRACAPLVSFDRNDPELAAACLRRSA